jgi:multidrug resistance protein, MATE family
MTLPTLVLVVVSPINAGVTYMLVHRTSLGLSGAPVALSVTYWLMFLLLSFATWLSPAHKRNGTWNGFHLRAVIDPGSSAAFLKLALPGILMVGTEWYAWLTSAP